MSSQKRSARFAPIEYWTFHVHGQVRQYGYAVRMPKDLQYIRLCARFDGEEWVIDHYDSGYAFVGPVMCGIGPRQTTHQYVERWRRNGKSRTSAVHWAIRYIRHLKALKNQDNYRILCEGPK